MILVSFNIKPDPYKFIFYKKKKKKLIFDVQRLLVQYGEFFQKITSHSYY